MIAFFLYQLGRGLKNLFVTLFNKLTILNLGQNLFPKSPSGHGFFSDMDKNVRSFFKNERMLAKAKKHVKSFL